MAYTYTERKRIRKNFGNRDSVLEIPYLLQMQKDAYTAFLQADVAPKKRTAEGLQAAFEAGSILADDSPNTLRLVLANDQDKPLVCGDVDFELSFTESGETANQPEPPGTLNINNVQVEVETQYMGKENFTWTVESPSSQAKSKYWTLKARKNEAGAILGVGATGFVSFLIKNVRAKKPGIALATLRYRNVAGFGNGLNRIGHRRLTGGQRKGGDSALEGRHALLEHV